MAKVWLVLIWRFIVFVDEIPKYLFLALLIVDHTPYTNFSVYTNFLFTPFNLFSQEYNCAVNYQGFAKKKHLSYYIYQFFHTLLQMTIVGSPFFSNIDKISFSVWNYTLHKKNNVEMILKKYLSSSSLEVFFFRRRTNNCAFAITKYESNSGKTTGGSPFFFWGGGEEKCMMHDSWLLKWLAH